MMEDIVLLETMKAADKDHRVFKLQFEAGEFDMVIYDQKENSCEIFEIKHSSKQVPFQYRHLVDEDKCQRTERRFGPIHGRYILYRGEDAPDGKWGPILECRELSEGSANIGYRPSTGNRYAVNRTYSVKGLSPLSSYN